MAIQSRQLEMEACSKALAVLSSDDAHDLFTKTFNPSLLEKESTMHSERRSQASKLLSAVAQKMQNPRLATLAVRVRLDAFTRVKKAIDDMVIEASMEAVLIVCFLCSCPCVYMAFIMFNMPPGMFYRVFCS